ncbi:MAG TPA: hypothetical protein VMZ50_12860 [Phycisphaerae bacterium]|nr:hypothetical protein [Phycisphaerae bacterium]
MVVPMHLSDWLRNEGAKLDAGSREWRWQGGKFAWAVRDDLVADADLATERFIQAELGKWKMADAGYCVECGTQAGADLQEQGLCGPCATSYEQALDAAFGSAFESVEPPAEMPEDLDDADAPRIQSPDESRVR